MSIGITPQLPLTVGLRTGFDLVTDMRTLVRQNLINLVLTSPTERVMYNDFGVGLRTKFVFEPNGQPTYGNISSAIQEQAAKYMKYISIDDVSFKPTSEAPHDLGVTITYTVVAGSVEFRDEIEMPLDPKRKKASDACEVPTKSSGNWPDPNESPYNWEGLMDPDDPNLI